MLLKRLQEHFSPQEHVLMFISFVVAIILVPFGLYRLMHGDIVMAVFDLAVAGILFLIFSFVYRHKYLKTARQILAFFLISSVVISAHIKGLENGIWIFPGIAAVFYLLTFRVACVLLIIVLTAMASLLQDQTDGFSLTSIIVTYSLTALFAIAFRYESRMHEKSLKKMLYTDSLTNIKNRRAFHEDCLNFLEDKDELKFTSPCMLIFDIDDFKKINDDFGHYTGDNVLRAVSQHVRSVIDPQDGLYRVGGEEFAIVVKDICVELALKKAEQIRETVANNVLAENRPVTISIGCAKFLPDQDDLYAWYRRADDALYEAKNSGKNKVSSCLQNNIHLMAND